MYVSCGMSDFFCINAFYIFACKANGPEGLFLYRGHLVAWGTVSVSMRSWPYMHWVTFSVSVFLIYLISSNGWSDHGNLYAHPHQQQGKRNTVRNSDLHYGHEIPIQTSIRARMLNQLNCLHHGHEIPIQTSIRARMLNQLNCKHACCSAYTIYIRVLLGTTHIIILYNLIHNLIHNPYPYPYP